MFFSALVVESQFQDELRVVVVVKLKPITMEVYAIQLLDNWANAIRCIITIIFCNMVVFGNRSLCLSAHCAYLIE